MTELEHALGTTVLVIGAITTLASATLFCVWRRTKKAGNNNTSHAAHQTFHNDAVHESSDAEEAGTIDLHEENDTSGYENPTTGADTGYEHPDNVDVDVSEPRGVTSRADSKRASQKSAHSIHAPVPMDAYNDTDSEEEDGMFASLRTMVSTFTPIK